MERGEVQIEFIWFFQMSLISSSYSREDNNQSEKNYDEVGTKTARFHLSSFQRVVRQTQWNWCHLYHGLIVTWRFFDKYLVSNSIT